MLSRIGNKSLDFRIKCLDMSPKYRKREEGKVEVEVDITLVSISSLNLARMEVSLDLHLAQSWTDSRCRFRHLPRQESLVTLQGYGLQDRLQHLWIPDTVITNAVTTASHPAPQPQQTTKVAMLCVNWHSKNILESISKLSLITR